MVNSVMNLNTSVPLDLQTTLKETLSLEGLQMRLDAAEKDGTRNFHDFSDVEMIKWFLYERRHLNKKNDRSERTIKEYERELGMFIQHMLQHGHEFNLDMSYIIEGSFFKSLQSRHLRRYQEWLAAESPHVKRKGPYSPATLERKTTIIKAFFTFLYKNGYITDPIHEGLRIATVRKDDRPNRDLGPADVVRLLDVFKEADHPVMFGLIHVLTTTGIRNEELCILTVNDMKRDGIQGGYYLDVLGKGNKRRQVPLKEKVIQSIIEFREARGLPAHTMAEPISPLFTTSTGKAFSPSYLSQYLKREIVRVAAAADLTVKPESLTPHVFRHAFAIISKLNGVELHDIMRSLGHEKIETTMIYLEKIFEKERHAIHSWDSEVLGGYI